MTIRRSLTSLGTRALAGSNGRKGGGENFYFLIWASPLKIFDLSSKLLIKVFGLKNTQKDIRIKVTGIRPGEKLYESG